MVDHGKTGYIETDKLAYANKAIECLTNDTLWQQLHSETLQHRWRKSYQDRALDWEKIIQ